MKIAFAELAAILPLRHAILRAGLPIEAAHFEGDDEPATRHFKAVADGRVLGCCTIVRRPWEGEPAYQLRGMAVVPGSQKSGVGRLLLAAVENYVRDEGFTRTLWCNARSPAADFYERNGWRRASEEFVIETAGPHYRMTRSLQADRADGPIRGL